MNKMLVLASGFAAMLMLTAPALADRGGNGRGHKPTRNAPAVVNAPAAVTAVTGPISVQAGNLGITVGQAQTIAKDLHMTGYSSLPPGIAKNLGRGKPLPPGIAKKQVPATMLSKLPVHQGYEWVISGADLVLVKQGSSVVAEILAGVFR